EPSVAKAPPLAKPDLPVANAEPPVAKAPPLAKSEAPVSRLVPPAAKAEPPVARPLAIAAQPPLPLEKPSRPAASPPRTPPPPDTSFTPAAKAAAPGGPAPSVAQGVPPGLQELIPKMQLQVVVYSDTPAERLVFINNHKYLEGQMIDGKVVVERITQDSAIL